MPRKAIDYSKTIIYKLIKNDDFNNENIYIGSTINFPKRKCLHKHNCCNENSNYYHLKVYQNIRENGGWEEWKMIEIEKYPCNDKREAEAREEYWKCELNANLNMIRAFRTEEQKIEDKRIRSKEDYIKNKDIIDEKHKKYYTENAEKITERVKQYKTENAEKIAEKASEWYEKNKEEITKKRKEQITCECGSIIRQFCYSRHKNSLKHQNYLKTITI
jgi:hypothetical protein